MFTQQMSAILLEAPDVSINEDDIAATEAGQGKNNEKNHNFLRKLL